METKYNPHEVCNNQLAQLTKTINMFQELYNACREDSEKLRKENRELRGALEAAVNAVADEHDNLCDDPNLGGCWVETARAVLRAKGD